MPQNNASANPTRIFSVPPGRAFLRETAQALVDGRLIEGFVPADEPLRLTEATVYLPTRRAVRAFGDEILAAVGSRAGYLPAIRTLGDVEDDEFAGLGGDEIELPPAVGEFTRRLELASLVRRWTAAMSQQARETYGEEDIVLPSSAADALWLAGDLARFLDQMETEEISWQALVDLPGEIYAQWWSLTTAFLRVVTEAWPQIRAESGRIEPAIRRRLLLERRAAALAGGSHKGPVIVAGSTGSIPATARFLAAVRRHAMGAIVLPGLDKEMPEGVWRQLQAAPDADGAGPLAGHPQAGLASLLAGLGVVRDDVRLLGAESDAEQMRRRLVAASLLPAKATADWIAAGRPEAVAFDQLAVVEAPNQRLEALAIAIAMREAAEDTHRIAALVTPDRNLARRVQAELLRFDIVVDDSAGKKLADTPAGALALLVARIAGGDSSTAALAELCQHPLIARDDETRRVAGNFELAVLRSPVANIRPAQLAAASARAGDLARADRHAHPAVRRLQGADWASIADFAARLDASFAPLEDWPASLTVNRAVAGLRQTLLRLCPVQQCWQALTGGMELLELLDRVGEEAAGAGADRLLDFAATELANLLLALFEGQVVRAAHPAHPRLHIWGPLEARLQEADLVILGGLNEGNWPATARTDAYLNRPMRAAIGLSPPERRTGQAAHDFAQLACRRQVVITRSLREGSAPTIASRWLQRLTVLSGAGEILRARGDRLLRLAREIDAPAGAPRRIDRPCPVPAVALRPKRLSVTEIETLIRDPYAVHARHVLGLRQLPPLQRAFDYSLRGILLHDIAARFVAGRPADEPAAAGLRRFVAIASEILAAAGLAPDQLVLLRGRFAEIGRAFCDFEAERASRVAESLIEAGGSVEIGEGEFVLTGRADRIDILTEGGIEIIDYKSGEMPGVQEARILAPQLALEAGMAARGAFGARASGPPRDLVYVALKPTEELKTRSVLFDGKKPIADPDEFVERKWSQLRELIGAYRDPLRGYPSRVRVKRANEMSGEFDHLARVREWSAGTEGEDE